MYVCSMLLVFNKIETRFMCKKFVIFILRNGRGVARGSGVAVILGGVEPGAVGARPPRAIRGGRRAAEAAHGASLHHQGTLPRRSAGIVCLPLK